MALEEDKCPWCGHCLEDLWEYNLDDGDTSEEECPSCGKAILISLSISYDYTIEPTGCEMHRLRLSDHWYDTDRFDFVEFRCAECKERFYDWQLPGSKHPKIKPGGYVFIEDAIPVVEKRGIKVIPLTET